ncbi:MAG TPA: metal-sensitive transcriptional regulator [Hyphomicrobiaceae bacterium]|jgi:DNA-binding FrmR family transcriptional regulator|nr:metal-sensitive transcriptional regulator [Hyphomicrobiaceae bacterium]
MHELTKNACIQRLNRIEGQVRGLVRMVEEGRYCIDIITQLSAARAALRRVEQEVLRDHIGHCVRAAMQSEDARTQDRSIQELIDVLARSRG